MVHNRICQTRPEAPCQPAKPQPQPNSRVSPVSLHRIVHVKQDLVPHIFHTSPWIQHPLMMSVPHHSHYPVAPATFRTNRSAITPATHSSASRVTMPMSSFFLDFVTPDPPRHFHLGDTGPHGHPRPDGTWDLEPVNSGQNGGLNPAFPSPSDDNSRFSTSLARR